MFHQFVSPFVDKQIPKQCSNQQLIVIFWWLLSNFPPPATAQQPLTGRNFYGKVLLGGKPHAAQWEIHGSRSEMSQPCFMTPLRG